MMGELKLTGRTNRRITVRIDDGNMYFYYTVSLSNSFQAPDSKT